MSVMSEVNTTRSTASERKSSRLPGGFETDNEGDGDLEDDLDHDSIGEMESDEWNAATNKNIYSEAEEKPTEQSIHQQSQVADSSSISLPSNDSIPNIAVNNTVLEEQEMNRKLAEFESSFVPELSHLSVGTASLDDVAGQERHFELNNSFQFPSQDMANPANPRQDFMNARATGDDRAHFHSPMTPPAMYKTPAPEAQDFREKLKTDTISQSTPEFPNTSALEQLSSSPTAARTVSRVQSMASIGGYETADEHDFLESPSKKPVGNGIDPEATPKKNEGHGGSQLSIDTAFQTSLQGSESGSPNASRRRPKYLNSRSATSRLSYDSVTSSTTEMSEATLSADFALQSGGAAPESRLQRKPRMTLSRSTSLGSIVSGVSNMSDDESQSRRTASGAPELSTLQEENALAGKTSPNQAMVTPKASTANFTIPSDTVVANHVRDLEVPGSFQRQYRQLNSAVSPSKPLSMAVMTPGPKKGLTLKEHRSTVEKLGKENFDLKMKIHFLDQALQRRSEEGVKELITENVQLKSDRMRLEKDNHSFRKQIRELQRKLDSAGVREDPNADQGYATDEERSPTAEEEVIYLRERVETNEIMIEKLRSENIAKESEKRRLAGMIKNLGDTRAAVSDVGSREERDMWKDMLESETIAREQSEEESRRLREENAKLKQEMAVGSRSKRGKFGGSVVSLSSSAESTSASKPENAEVERLRHEISELQKMISAQASTLTSRNKEKERLYQEIEDLKLNGRMGGLRSVAGDSILERSASRARSNSRASNGTRFSRISEPEREQYELRIGELRDEVSQLKLGKQELQDQFDQAIAELDALDQQAQDDLQEFNDVLAEQKADQENLLRELQDREESFEQLKNEAQEEIDGLGDELDAKVDECARLQEELKVQSESVQTLENEVRSTSEGLARLEQDSQESLSRYHTVKSQLEDANREFERMERNLEEAETKVQRLAVEQESSHNEIAFLREEQDGDKIKIGDLESLLKKTHLNLDSEREKARDLERRLNEERSQREIVSNQEKQDVQRMINELNREATNAKDELRRIRKAMSSRDIEVTTYKDRLDELENGLRHVMGEPNGTGATLLSAVNKIRRELEQATLDLDHTSKRLDEHQNLLSNRDALLESSSLEYRKVADLLEKERQARRQDKHSFDQVLKSHQQAARALSTNNAKIAELEHARQGHRKQVSQLETQFKDQLAERNQILLTIWKKLSGLCGPDWTHNNSLINGNLPSQEVIGNMLFWPGFSRNLLLAAKQVEGTFSTLKDKIKRVERELWKEYHSLEQQFELRNKKLERIEESWEKMKLRQQEIDAGINFGHHAHGSRPGTSRDPSAQKLKGENRRLKAELQLLQSQQHNASHLRSHNRSVSRQSTFSGMMSHDGTASIGEIATALGGGIPARRSSMGQKVYQNGDLQRHSNSNDIQALDDLEGLEDHDAAVANDDHARPYLDPQPPSNGSLTRPAIRTSAPPTSHGQRAFSRPDSVATGASEATTLTSLQNMHGNQAQWMHRLRELERRLKHEREQRLVDRSGMRKRLEERDAVNEELRKELEREKVRRSWDMGEVDVKPGNVYDVVDEHNQQQYVEDKGMGTPSLNNRMIEIDGSPTRNHGRGN